MSPYYESIQTQASLKSSTSWSLMGPARLSFPGCEEEERFVFCVAQIDWDPVRRPLHLAALQTMYKVPFKTIPIHINTTQQCLLHFYSPILCVVFHFCRGRCVGNWSPLGAHRFPRAGPQHGYQQIDEDVCCASGTVVHSAD